MIGLEDLELTRVIERAAPPAGVVVVFWISGARGWQPPTAYSFSLSRATAGEGVFGADPSSVRKRFPRPRSRAQKFAFAKCPCKLKKSYVGEASRIPTACRSDDSR